MKKARSPQTKRGRRHFRAGIGPPLVFLWFLLALTSAQAQIPTATIAGSICGEDGKPILGVRVQASQNGQVTTLLSDARGEFAYHFAAAGRLTLGFNHASTPETGKHEIVVDPGSPQQLSVILHSGLGGGVWEFRTTSAGAGDPWLTERILSANQIEFLPGTGHLAALLNLTEPSIVTERFDISGITSYREPRMGVRGSSWSQNQFSIHGMTVAQGSGEAAVFLPDLTALETVVYTVGDSPTIHTGPGAHLTLISKTGDRELHGQAHLYFQSGALQNTNPTERYRFFRITESDERWRHFLNGGLQLGGPLGSRPWTYFGSISDRDIEKRIRNHPLPVSANVMQATFHLTGQASTHDSLSFFASVQRTHEPQAGASPQITRESSLDQKRRHYAAQGVWTRNLSARSLLDIRMGGSFAGGEAGFQPGAAGQSCEDLFPGYALAGLPDSPSPWDMLAMLQNTRRGPAPLATSANAGSLAGSGAFTTVREGPWRSSHRIALGINYQRMSLTQSDESIDGVNLLFFEGVPNSVRLLNTPARTRDRIHQLGLYATDRLSLPRMTWTVGFAADSTQGENLVSDGSSANRRHWMNIAGRIGFAFQVLNRGPIVVRAGAAQISHQPLAETWTAVNPEGLGFRLYSWNDSNGDRWYQPGENARLLKVYGAPNVRMDPGLANPKTTEFTAGFTAGRSDAVMFQFFGFHRSEHDLISLVNEGVPFSAYTSVPVLDPGPDGEVGTADDRMITAYNQRPDTLGQDRYLLTNPPGFSSYSQGFEMKLGFSFRRFQLQAAMTRFRAVASTAPGVTARENDTSALLGVFDDPNNALLAKGSTYFDRGTIGRLWATFRLPWKVRCALIFAYQDGLPYGRYLPVKGLNQGVIAVLATQRGPGVRGSVSGPRTTFNSTADMRISREFTLRRGILVATLDTFNLANRANALVETEITAPTQYWRIPLRFETPRSLQLGIRYQW